MKLSASENENNFAEKIKLIEKRAIDDLGARCMLFLAYMRDFRRSEATLSHVTKNMHMAVVSLELIEEYVRYIS